VSGAKPVGSLTAEETKKLCEDSKAYFERTVASAMTSFQCQGMAFSAGAGDACRQTYAKCMASPPPSTGGSQLGIELECSSPKLDPRCANVTVEELTTCLRDIANVYKSVASKLPVCTEAEARPLVSQLEQPPSSCLALQQKGCPAFGSASSSGGTQGDPPPPPPDPQPLDAGTGG
jgi:hypothetical protein